MAITCYEAAIERATAPTDPHCFYMTKTFKISAKIEFYEGACKQVLRSFFIRFKSGTGLAGNILKPGYLDINIFNSD